MLITIPTYRKVNFLEEVPILLRSGVWKAMDRVNREVLCFDDTELISLCHVRIVGSFEINKRLT